MKTEELVAILQAHPGLPVTVYDGHGTGSSDIEAVLSEVLVDDVAGTYAACLHLQDRAYPSPDRDEQDLVITDLVIMLRRLLGGKKPIGEKTKVQIQSYLQRKGLQGRILR